MRVNEESEKAVIRITLYDNEAMGAHWRQGSLYPVMNTVSIQIISKHHAYSDHGRARFY